jgi:hypothetical protein
MCVEAVQAPLSPHSRCFLCEEFFREGEQTTIKQIQIPFRFLKQRKKAKGSTHVGLRVHVVCPKAATE